MGGGALAVPVVPVDVPVPVVEVEVPPVEIPVPDVLVPAVDVPDADAAPIRLVRSSVPLWNRLAGSTAPARSAPDPSG